MDLHWDFFCKIGELFRISLYDADAVGVHSFPWQQRFLRWAEKTNAADCEGRRETADIRIKNTKTRAS
jgi:hypothetical protein